MWATTKRPQDFASVIGQEDAIQTLEKSKGNTTFILHGSSGVGKTTLARIFANELDSEIIEIDGASNNGVDNIRSLIDAAMYIPVFTKHKAFIIDECFHASTKVTMCNNSIKPISTINIGDRVKNLVGDGVVTNVFKNTIPLDRLVLVKLSNGQEILTTKDHLFFTKDGWVEAQHLQEGEKLYEGTNKKRKNSYMCDLPQRVQNEVGGKKLLEGVQEQIASKVWKRISSIIARITNSTRSIEKNVDNKSNVKREKCTKNDGNQEAKWNIEYANKKSWWKWENNNSPTKVERRFGERVCFRVGDKDSQNESGWLPTHIQSRPRISKEHVGDRGGWQLPSLEIEYSKRLKENATFGGLRVESIEIYESTSRREYFRSYINDFDTSLGYVELFDLEVSNHPSYYVENVLVHNCHQLTSQAWNALLKILEEAPKTTIWILCTTEFAKIPTTIKSRSISIRLKNIDKATLKSYLISLAKQEGYLEVDSEVIDEIVSRSEGRVREAITSLETYLTTNVLNYNFSTKDIINLVGNMFSGDLKACNDSFALLTNDDVYAIVGFLKDYIKFLMFVSVEGVKAESALTQYTNIHAKYIQDLRALQQSIWSTCPYDGEPWHATIRYIYDIYDTLTRHYNDFRDGRQAFEMATLRVIAKVKGNE